MRIWFRPPMLFIVGSTTAIAKAAATAASAALPPISSIRTPASVASGWAVATAPLFEREVWSLLCACSASGGRERSVARSTARAGVRMRMGVR